MREKNVLWARGPAAAIAACAVALAAGVTGAAPASSAKSPSFTMTIGDVEAFSGDLGALGPAADKAEKLAVAQLNKAAKQAGLAVTFKLKAADTQSDPQAAISAARQVVNAGATCLTGPISTPEAIAILNSVTKVRKIAMFPSATSTKLRTVDDGHTIFRTTPPDSLQAIALEKAVAQSLGGAGGKVLAIGYQNSPYGEGLAKTIAAIWTKSGGKVSGPLGYDPNQSSYDSEAGKLTADNPDAFVFADFPDTFGKVAAALLRTGKFSASKLFVSDALAVTPIPSDIPAEALNGAHATSAGAPVGTPQAKAFDKVWRSAPGPGRSPLDANEFDAGIMCGLAAVAAGTNSAAKVDAQMTRLDGPEGKPFTFTRLADAMKALVAGQRVHYVGVSGPIQFDAHGDTSSGLYDLSTWRDGKLVLVRKINTK